MKPLVVNTTGKTDWAPETKKYILYDWQTGTHPMGVGIGANANAIRRCPPTSERMAYAELREWQARGSPLRCVAIVVVSKKGWHWTPYNGQLSWAAKDYRAEWQNIPAKQQPSRRSQRN
jgi:hypothetical protein